MASLVRLPDSVSDDEAILLSDIFPTAYESFDRRDAGWLKTVLTLS
jgi:threonine dehydrogenase-like Zn-dependent dehydrogenase